jgi:flagellar hook assembly protein FlgD
MNPVATLAFATKTPGSVSVRIYDVAGRLARTVLSGQFFEIGDHSVVLDGRGDDGGQLGSGVYFYRIETTDGSLTGRFVIAR